MGFPLQVEGGYLLAQQGGLFNFLLFQGSLGSPVPRGALEVWHTGEGRLRDNPLQSRGALRKAVRQETVFPIGSGAGWRPIRALSHNSLRVPSAQPREGGRKPGHAPGGNLQEQQAEAGTASPRD